MALWVCWLVGFPKALPGRQALTLCACFTCRQSREVSQHQQWAERIPPTLGPAHPCPGGAPRRRPRAGSQEAMMATTVLSPPGPVPKSLCPRGGESLGKGRVSPREHLCAGKRPHSQSGRGFFLPAPSYPKDQGVDHAGRQSCRGTQGCQGRRGIRHMQVATDAFSPARGFMHLNEGSGVSFRGCPRPCFSVPSGMLAAPAMDEVLLLRGAGDGQQEALWYTFPFWKRVI